MGKESTAQKVEPDKEKQKTENEETQEIVEDKTDENFEEAAEEPTTVSPEESEGDVSENAESEEEPLTIEQLEEKYKAELAEKDEKYIRLAAEFENFKKRSAQEMQTRFKFSNQQLALNIITGLDNLERALAQAAEEEENAQLQEFAKGIEMVQQQLYDALKQNNIERMFPKGELFDPNNHEAMGVIETDEVEPDHIAQVFQAGYVLHDRVIRPAMVQVAKKKQ